MTEDVDTTVLPGGRFTRPVGQYVGKIEYVRGLMRPGLDGKPPSPSLEWCFNMGAVPPEGEDTADENWYVRRTTSKATGGRSILASWAAGLGIDLTLPWDASDLVGREIEVIMTVNEKGYNAIDRLVPRTNRKAPLYLVDEGPRWLREDQPVADVFADY